MKFKKTSTNLLERGLNKSMIEKFNGFVYCLLPCSSYCNLRDNSYEYYCDKCKNQVNKLYEWNGQQLCINCLEEELDEVQI